MGKTLYLECSYGISGDMVVGALLDLGANEDGLRRALASLGVGGFEVRVSRRTVNAIDACDFDVVLDDEHDGHDHDMAYLYGGLGEGLAPEDEEREHKHEHHHHHDHGHDHHDHDHHDHDHGHDHHDHDHHEHRTPADVARIIDGADLAPRARQTAHSIFAILGEAEAKAHGVPLEEVHFHEVGAVDSIVDVVAAAYCLDDLDVTDVIVSPFAEGEGRIRVAHGVLSVPVPAVVNIASAHGLTLAPAHRPGELVTPTGAAIAAAVKTADELPASYRITGVGVGSGKRAYDPPSMLRAMTIEPADASDAAPAPSLSLSEPPLWQLETEIDDSTGEMLGHALERLFAEGAREAHYLPCYMKKNRPAYQVQVLCTADKVEALERVLFEETTTIGVRRMPVWRTALEREEVDLTTPLGPARGKRVTLPGGSCRTYPEHDSVVALAAAADVPYPEAYRAVQGACAALDTGRSAVDS